MIPARVRPVIWRELRRQSRSSAGSWQRVGVALVGGLICLWVLATGAFGPSAPSVGGRAFHTLSWLGVAYAMLIGVWRTSDAVSRERREGTLGLLFLTDLRGVDVVLGKLAGEALPAVYALLGLFPVLALAVPFGGVAGGEVFRVSLVLLGTLMLALASGLWASAVVRDAGRSLWVGLALMGGITLLPPMFEILLRRGPIPTVSPAVAMSLAEGAGYRVAPERFWLTVVAIPALALVLVWRAGRRAETGWLDADEPATVEEWRKARGAQPDGERWAPEGEPVWQEDLSAYPGGQPSGPAHRPEREWLESSPGRWLAAWGPTHSVLLGLAVLVLALEGLLMLMSGGGVRALSVAAANPMFFLVTTLVPAVVLAYAAAHSIVEARRHGGLELVLPTPLSPEELVRGFERNVWSQMETMARLAGAALVLAACFSLLGALASGRSESIVGGIGVILHLATRVIQVIAVVRVGLYYGMRAGSVRAAVARAVGWTLGLPASILMFVVPILFWLIPFEARSWWIGGLSFGVTLVHIGYLYECARRARHRMVDEFRGLAATPPGGSPGAS